jgi:hypothetical protein
MIPGLNLSEGERPYTQRELDYISKIAYRTAITDPTVRNLEARTGLVGAQTEQARARTEFLNQQVQWYGQEMTAKIKNIYSEIENRLADNTLNREKFNELKLGLSKRLEESFNAQKVILGQAEAKTRQLRDQYAKAQAYFQALAKPTDADKKILADLKAALAAAESIQVQETNKFRAIPEQSRKVLEDFAQYEDQVPTSAEDPMRPDFSGLIGGGVDDGVARNRP